MQSFSVMANYNTWVNARIFNLCADLDDHAYRQDTGAFFGSIHNTLNHILLVDILWLARLKGEKVHYIQSLGQILYDDLSALADARVKIDRELTEYVQELSEEDLKDSVAYTRMSGQTGEDTVWEVLITLFNHQTHHRGQIHAMLTQSGIPNSSMPDIDVVDYLASASD